MADTEDSIVERAQRVRHSLEGLGAPDTAQAAVGGPCPECGGRVETVLHADSTSVRCEACGHTFALHG